MESFARSTRALSQTVFRRFESGIWIVAAIRLLTAAGFSMCIPFLALYLHQVRGIPMTLVGIIILAGGLCSAVSHVIGGALADRLGRRRLLLGATGISVLLYWVVAALIGASAPIWAIAVAYIAGRVALVTTQPTASAIVADLSPKERLTESYGLMRVGGNVGWAAGPALGGYLATFLSYGWLFGVAGVMTVLALGLVALFLRESFKGEAEQVDMRSTLRVGANRGFLAFTLLSLLVFLGMAHMGSTLSVFTVDRLGFSTAEYGLLLTANGLMVVVFQYPVARLVDWMGRVRSLVLGSLLYGLGYLSFGWVGSFGWGIGAIAVVTAGEVVFAPTTLAVVGELAPYEWRGRYMGFFGLSQTLGISLGPLVGGVLLDAFPTRPLFIWGAIGACSLLAALGFHRWGLARRKGET